MFKTSNPGSKRDEKGQTVEEQDKKKRWEDSYLWVLSFKRKLGETSNGDFVSEDRFKCRSLHRYIKRLEPNYVQRKLYLCLQNHERMTGIQEKYIHIKCFSCTLYY